MKNYPCRSRGSVHSTYILSLIYFFVKWKTWLGLADDFRTLDWREVFNYPEGILKQMRELLATT
jgi:hypothetical protein